MNPVFLPDLEGNKPELMSYYSCKITNEDNVEVKVFDSEGTICVVTRLVRPYYVIIYAGQDVIWGQRYESFKSGYRVHKKFIDNYRKFNEIPDILKDFISFRRPIHVAAPSSLRVS